MEPLTIAFVVIGVILLLRLLGAICGSSAPEAIGNIGESRTAHCLHKLSTDTYTVFNNIIVSDSEGRTTQIDHIVVSRYGIFVVETLSVMIQIFWYKKTGKRFFKMAPIHHHFEQLGWKETTVVTRFWIIGFVLTLVGLTALINFN